MLALVKWKASFFAAEAFTRCEARLERDYWPGGFYLLRNNVTFTSLHGAFSLFWSTDVVKINRSLETFDECFSTSEATCRDIYRLWSAGTTKNTSEPWGRRIYERGEQEKDDTVHTYAPNITYTWCTHVWIAIYHELYI